MKKRKIFAVVMAAVMTLSMVACGEKQTGNDVTPTTAPTATTAPTEAPVAEPTTAPVAVQETSIDFEDGNYGFAMVKTKPRKADFSNISLVDYNGSKALFVENQGGAEMYLGIDIDAVLGDKVTEVRSISMTVGTQHPDGDFASVSGYLYAYTGEKLTESKLEDWSVYMPKKNPKTVTFTIPEGVSFTAGNDNYIALAKITDSGAALGSFYVDDIRFFDAAGNVLKGDTTVVMEAPDGFLAVVEEDDEPSANVVKVAGDAAYTGDWTQSGLVPAETFTQFAGKDVQVTVKFELTGDKDYYIWAPIDAAWNKLGGRVVLPAEAAGKYRGQEDGTVAIDDQSITEMTFTLPAALVDEMIAAGGTFAGMTYGVVAYEIELGSAAAATMKETVAADDAYKGDWGQSGLVPGDVFAKFAGKDVKVTAKFELTGDKDYYIWAPMDSTWAKIGDKVGIPVKTAAEEGDKFHAQADATVVIDDHSITEITFTIPAALVDTIIAAGDGSFSGMTYGLVVYEVVLEAEAAADTAVKEKVAADDSYKGDWGQSGLVPGDVFAKFAGMDVEVTAKFELTGDKDYYIWAPMDSSWAKIGDKVGVPVKTAAEEGDLFHAQADGTIVLDDQSITEITFTIPASLVDTIIAAGDGSLSGQTYGVVVYEVVLVGTPAAGAPAADTPAEPVVEAPVELTGSVVYTGSATMADSTWWTEKELTLADLIGNLDPATVEGIKFTSDTDFQLGYNSSATGAWAQPAMAAEHVINDIAMNESFALKLFLSKGDGVEYTINWEVYGNGEAAVEEPVAEEPAAADLVITFTGLTAGGYGYEAKVNGDVVDVFIAGQYQEIQYVLPEAVDLAAYTKLIVDVTSNAQLDIKLVNPEAALNEYSQKTPFLDNYTAEGTAITEPIVIDLTAYATYDLSQINFMAMGTDTTFTIKSITFTK